jgi:hypothetical protein
MQSCNNGQVFLRHDPIRTPVFGEKKKDLVFTWSFVLFIKEFLNASSPDEP